LKPRFSPNPIDQANGPNAMTLNEYETLSPEEKEHLRSAPNVAKSLIGEA
jgi:hypothetical protein